MKLYVLGSLPPHSNSEGVTFNEAGGGFKLMLEVRRGKTSETPSVNSKFVLDVTGMLLYNHIPVKPVPAPNSSIFCSSMFWDFNASRIEGKMPIKLRAPNQILRPVLRALVESVVSLLPQGEERGRIFSFIGGV